LFDFPALHRSLSLSFFDSELQLLAHPLSLAISTTHD
jgi:hypothetical protein